MQGNRQRPSLPGRRRPSTLGVWVLNCCVRNGNRWNHPAITTGFPARACALKTLQERNAEHFMERRRTLSSPSVRQDSLKSQALGVLVPVRSTPRGASTPGLSTPSSAGRLTDFHHEELHLGAGFTLRCFQRLSLPDAATRLHGWRHDRYTVGPSTPVLSYWEQPPSGSLRPRWIWTELSHDVLNPAHVPL